MEIILIAAMAANRVIGKDNAIPWIIPGEQAHFKKVTMGHPIIMGRKTWESIGYPLPGRRNIVVTTNLSFCHSGIEVVYSLDQGFALCSSESKVFVIGGEQIFSLALPLADTLIVTVIPDHIDGDTFFPKFSPSDFNILSKKYIEEPFFYTIRIYTRKKR